MFHLGFLRHFSIDFNVINTNRICARYFANDVYKIFIAYISNKIYETISTCLHICGIQKFVYLSFQIKHIVCWIIKYKVKFFEYLTQTI